MAFRALAFHHSDWRSFELCVHKPQFLQFLRWPIHVINSVDNSKLPFLAWFKVAYSVYFFTLPNEYFLVLYTAKMYFEYIFQKH